MTDSPAAIPQPISSSERIIVIDAVRGFALFGILLMNIEGFAGPLSAAIAGIDPALHGADRWADAAIYVLVQGKFYTLFSLLFGAGFAMMLQRAQQAGRDGTALYARRLAVLLVIGLLHAVLIWAGDILLSYALCGFVLLLAFRGESPRRMLGWGLALYAVPSVLFASFAGMTTLAQLDPEAAKEMSDGVQEQAAYIAEMIEAERAAYGSGSYADATLQRIDHTVMTLSVMPWLYGPMVLGMFLIGAWFMRTGAFAEPAAHRALYRRLAVVGWTVGLPMMLLSTAIEPHNDGTRLDLSVAASMALAEFASLLLCLGYLSTFVLLSMTDRARGLIAVLAAPGRMALTLYLLQSIVCTLVFYGYGLGWFEQLSRVAQTVFATALFALQVVFAHLWLARFRFGPAEWLWRTLTYGRVQPLRI